MTTDHLIYAVNAVTGTKSWLCNRVRGDKVQSSPALSSDGKVMYVGSGDSNLYAINT